MRHLTEGVTIRRLDDTDTAAIHRLAQLDSADPPAGDLLGAEVEGRLVAATPIAGGGWTIADPFIPTAELQALLELRAEQIRASEPRVRVALLQARSSGAIVSPADSSCSQ
jgi:hypothetical protein